MTATPQEAVGHAYDPALMLRARELTWAALERIRGFMLPGIGEEEAKAKAEEVFRALGMQRLWHRPYIRIGANTLKTYRQPSEPDVRLGEDDIYFVDLGLVFDGHEGDVGDTFTVGHAPDRQACADAARALFHEVAAEWRANGTSGHDLYAFAARRAEAMGWRFNHDIKGHRLGDYPHAVHKAGDLGDFASTPAPGLWVLEIQIAHPSEPYGAFYEDLLLDPAPAD
jgi:Xaa-Pro aminopeptidase